jgi:RHS repeat-associated protein
MGHQLMGFERNGNFIYFINDGLTSVRALLDEDGDEVATFEHDEYGNGIASSGTVSSPKTYVGGLGVHDDTADTRLLYMRRRHYDPRLGIFLSRDPIGFAGDLNLYRYAGSSPVTMVDPAGLDPSDPVEALTPYEAAILRDGLLNATRWAPPGDCPSLMSTIIFEDADKPGKAAYVMMTDGLVRYNKYNLNRNDWTKAWKVAFATATWGNELCHVRGTSGDKASDDYQNQILKNWIKGLDARMNEIGFTPNAPGKNTDEGWYLFELKRAATNILDPAYNGWPATEREMKVQELLWRSQQP